MKKNAHMYGMMLIGIIVIATFVYGIEIQPVVTAGSRNLFYQLEQGFYSQNLNEDLLKILAPRWPTGLPWFPQWLKPSFCKLKTFSSYEELRDYFNSNWNP